MLFQALNIAAGCKYRTCGTCALYISTPSCQLAPLPIPVIPVRHTSEISWQLIMSMKASKSDAIHMLKDHFHVKQEEIMAFGDNFNDIDMIRYAGLGVAMGNAADEVKEAADIVTDINDNEGERQILDQYFK